MLTQVCPFLTNKPEAKEEKNWSMEEYVQVAHIEHVVSAILMERDSLWFSAVARLIYSFTVAELDYSLQPLSFAVFIY